MLYRAHQEGTGKTHGKLPWAINISELQKVTLLGTAAHIPRKSFVLKAKFISPVVPQGHGLDPAPQECRAGVN